MTSQKTVCESVRASTQGVQLGLARHRDRERGRSLGNRLLEGLGELGIAAA